MASLRLRANPWSSGDGLRLALGRGAELSAGLEEFYGRNMPDARLPRVQFVPLAQLYGRFARVYNERGEEFFDGRGLVVGERPRAGDGAATGGAARGTSSTTCALEQPVRRPRRSPTWSRVAPTRVDPAELPFPAPPGARVAVRVAPGITHTIGGLRIDEQARVVGADGLFAAGADVGGISTGGYASGLAAALVFGRIAAESALDGLEVRAGPGVVRQRRGRDLDHLLLEVVDLDPGAHSRRVAVGLAELVAARLPDEEEVLSAASAIGRAS